MSRPLSTLFAIAVACAALGCRSLPKHSAAPARTKAATCASLSRHLTSFGDVLDASTANAKTRVVTYAGLLELLLSFEGATVDLDRELGALGSNGETEPSVRRARKALERATAFARGERDAVEKHAHEVAPLATETQAAWRALRGVCEGKRAPDCTSVRDTVAKFDAAETSVEHERAVADLTALRLSTPHLVKARDRAVAASKAVQSAIRARAEASLPMPKRWAAVRTDLAGAMDGLLDVCKGEAPGVDDLIAADSPDPRRLTVLVHVKPSPGIARALLTLASSSTDADERAFYQARAEGGFGSGFFLVRKAEGGANEVLVVTNRHVIELGDPAALELADGTVLGPASVVYSNPRHDLAVLRPTGTVALREGFSFARTPAKDQQLVIATGFPGLIGRPSYQTTRGYVSNESFRLDDGAHQLTYVQHTAPIDPGSSGGPLTDESGHLLGVNTLKVTGREAVGFAVPGRYVLDTLRMASLVQGHHASVASRQKDVRLACLAFLAELAAAEPRPAVLEDMISNQLVATEGLDAAAALGGEDGFESLWNADSVRAMRIATLLRVRSAFMAGGGPSVLETCDDLDAASVTPDAMKYRVRLGNFETHELAFRWEHGRWKVDGFDVRRASSRPASRRLPPGGAGNSVPPGGKRVAPPGRSPRGRP